MIHIIGNADEFWRLRLTRLDTTDHFEFEWHDDILYRAPIVDPGDEVQAWYVEAVRLDDRDTVARVGTFEAQNEAREFMEVVAEDLAQMTKSEFEATYVEATNLGDTGVR